MAKKDARNTKGRIVDAAWSLFYEKGYEGTTIEEIVERSETSKGSFYHYFDSKDALLSSLSYLFDGEFTADRCGDMDTEMAREFFYAVSYGAAMNLHIKVLYGSNNHHIMEAMFKAFAKALDAATMYDERITDVLSTKGTL